MSSLSFGRFFPPPLSDTELIEIEYWEDPEIMMNNSPPSPSPSLSLSLNSTTSGDMFFIKLHLREVIRKFFFFSPYGDVHAAGEPLCVDETDTEIISEHYITVSTNRNQLTEFLKDDPRIPKDVLTSLTQLLYGFAKHVRPLGLLNGDDFTFVRPLVLEVNLVQRQFFIVPYDPMDDPMEYDEMPAMGIDDLLLLVDVLEKVSFNARGDQGNVDQCSICFDQFEDGVELARLPCLHFFHGECIEEWIVKGRPNCPMCRYALTPDID